MRESIRRALLIVAAVFSMAVVLVPDWCSYAPAWLRPYIGCPECTGGEAEAIAAGGGCSGASSNDTSPRQLHASAGRRMFEVLR